MNLGTHFFPATFRRKKKMRRNVVHGWKLGAKNTVFSRRYNRFFIIISG